MLFCKYTLYSPTYVHNLNDVPDINILTQILTPFFFPSFFIFIPKRSIDSISQNNVYDRSIKIHSLTSYPSTNRALQRNMQ